VRRKTHVPVRIFDGEHLPFPDKSFDSVMFVDVLHHTHDALTLLREAARVATFSVVIKDHFRKGFAADLILTLMDYVGNRGHDVLLPYNYLTPAEWAEKLAAAELTTVTVIERLGLYPFPFSILFDRSLHFLARLSPAK
jgi:SAM-dependent methyltransferase